jgi:hypothetical protein
VFAGFGIVLVFGKKNKNHRWWFEGGIYEPKARVVSHIPFIPFPRASANLRFAGFGIAKFSIKMKGQEGFTNP